MKSFQWANNSAPLSLSPNFILPEDKRPQLSEVSTLTSIPIIDLSEHGDNIDDCSSLVVLKISQACEEYGFFHIVNHGVPEEVCDKMMAAIANFFDLAPEQRAQLYTTDHKKQVKLYNYYTKVEGGGKVNMWSESFYHPWAPIEEFIHLKPEKIETQYREAFTDYAREIGSLVNRLLSLISKGLGLEKDCLQKMLGDEPRLKAQANFYPPCPDPELTLGLAVHTDLNALTILKISEVVPGLQVIKDGQWIAVPAVPNAFVVNLGDQIQVLSNGRYKSVHHRAVTNKTHPRMTMAMFYGPSIHTVIGPIEDLTDEEHPPRYRKYPFAEFLEEFFKQEGSRRMVKEAFELPN